MEIIMEREGEMSKAKEDYYKLKTDVFMASHESLVPAVENYVTELEVEKAELMAYIENIRNMAHEKYPHKDIIRSCEKALKK